MIINGRKVGKKTISRFWSRVAILGEDDCWIWQAGRNSKKKGSDYGVFYIGKSILTHRLALSFHLGYFVEAEEVMHTCDNCPCCNPRHLIAGTHLDNMRDMAKKGRANPLKGVNHPLAKLDDEKVRQIRKLHRLHEKYKKYTKAYLAEMFDVDSALIVRVVNKTSWGHVED